MFTPARVVATGNSLAVTCRAQPPSWRRLWASEKENFRLGKVPESVRGGASMSGFWRSRSRLRGPGSVAPAFPLTGCGVRPSFAARVRDCSVMGPPLPVSVLEGHPLSDRSVQSRRQIRLSPRLFQVGPAVLDDPEEVCVPERVGDLLRENFQRVRAAVAALVDRPKQVRKRDLTHAPVVRRPPDNGALPVAYVHHEDAFSAGFDLLEDTGVLPDVPDVHADAEVLPVHLLHDPHGLLQGPDRALHVHVRRAERFQGDARSMLPGEVS